MPQYQATILAAFIGAAIGSIGAVVVRHLLVGRTEQAQARAMLVQRYLYQLQDSAESLWYRLDNLINERGQDQIQYEYFKTTTLYALGRVLAIERVLALEGVYPQLDASYPELGSFLRDNRIDLKLQGLGFYQYDRIALAEAMLEREGERFRISTYLEFRKRYESEESPERWWLTPAEEAIQNLDQDKMQTLLKLLKEIALEVSKQTSIISPLAKQAGRSL